MAHTYTRTRTITFDPAPGTTIDATDFGFDDRYTFIYLDLIRVSSGAVLIRFMDEDDFIEVSPPFEIAHSSFKEIQLESDQASSQTVDIIASVAYTYG